MSEQKDLSGRIINAPCNKPVTSGTRVTSPNGEGGQTIGVMVGGYFSPDKK